MSDEYIPIAVIKRHKIKKFLERAMLKGITISFFCSSHYARMLGISTKEFNDILNEIVRTDNRFRFL